MDSRLVRDVNCGTCRMCCKHEVIYLHPDKGDVVESYETETVIHPVTDEPAFVLKKAPDGISCIYLTPAGCSVHDRRPVVCASFSCVEFYRRMKQTGDPLGLFGMEGSKQLLARGRELILKGHK